MSELIEFFVKTLVTYPEKVRVSVETQAGKSSITVFVAPEDRGRVIGKNGKTIRSIRQCVDAIFSEEQMINIDLVNDDQS